MRMKALLRTIAVAAIAIGVLQPAIAATHQHKVCRWDNRHYRVCEWVW